MAAKDHGTISSSEMATVNLKLSEQPPVWRKNRGDGCVLRFLMFFDIFDIASGRCGSEWPFQCRLGRLDRFILFLLIFFMSVKVHIFEMG